MDNLESTPHKENENSKKTLSSIIKVPLYIIAFIFVSLLFAYLTFKLVSFSRTVDVPDLYGKSLVEANELLSKKGLNLKVEGEDYDSTIPPGYIFWQDVPAGSMVKEQRRIKVMLSKGPRVQMVPFVVGESINKAESILLQRGLKIGRIIRVHSNSIDKDRVIAQKPGPDEKITERITIIVSTGHYDVVYYCPDFQGKTYREALSLAEKIGLKLKATGFGDIVKSQKPRAGTQMRTGETIEIQLERVGLDYSPTAPEI